jgi:hypothetical protein
MLLVKLTVLYINPCAESLLYIACGNLVVNMDQEHNLQKLTQNKTCSVLTAMI